MANETFQLAILLSLKDAASGGLDAFSARAHRATAQVENDLKKLEKEAKQSQQAIATDVQKKIGQVDKLSSQLANVDKLKNNGLQSAGKQTAAVVAATRKEAAELDKLTESLKKTGATDAAKKTEELSGKLKEEAKAVENLHEKLKQLQKLRKEGTEEAKQKATVLTGEIKEEAKSLDSLTAKLREVKELRTQNIEVKIKADDLKNTVHDLKTIEEQADILRQKLGREMAIAGVGTAGIALMAKGVMVAGKFQASMTDLKATLATQTNGVTNIAALGDDMAKAEKIAMRLGNDLPGTTEDFIRMMQVMKQNGLETTTILDGAAEAVANLAIANNAVPAEVAKDIAQFGQLYKLKGEDYGKATDVLSKLYTSAGIESGELIEGLKYFQGRSGAALGLSGLKDAQETLRMMGLLKKQGVEGSMAGTALDDFFGEFIKHKKKLEDLKNETGIKLDFFDAKGKLQGFDEIFKQMEQFNKLSEKDRVDWLEKIFGRQGLTAATTFLKTGADGWKKYNAEQEKTVSVTDKVAMKSKDFNNKLESLTGSLQNLVVTGFTPLLPELTKTADGLNTIVGSIQDFAQAHPFVTSTVADLTLLGTTALTLVGGFRAMMTAWELWKLSSAISGSGGIASYLGQTTVAANGTTTALATANVEARTLSGRFGALSKPIPIVLQVAAIMGLEALIREQIRLATEASNAQKGAKEMQTKNVAVQKSFYSDPNISPVEKKKEAGVTAGVVFNNLNKNQNELMASLQGENFGAQMKRTFASTIYGMGTIDLYSGLQTMFPKTIESSKTGNYVKPLEEIYGTNQAHILPNLRQIAGITGYDIGAWAEPPMARMENRYAGFDHKFSPDVAAQTFREKAPELGNTQVMTEFLSQLKTQLPKDQFLQVGEALQKAFPTSFLDAMTQLNTAVPTFTQNATTLTDNLSNINQPLSGFPDLLNNSNQNFMTLNESTQRLPDPLNRTSTAAANAANSLDNLTDKISSFQMPTIPTPQVQTINVPSAGTTSGASPAGGTPVGRTPLVRNPFAVSNPLMNVNPPSKASGGAVLSDGLVYVHAGEDILPANVTKSFETTNFSKSFSRETEKTPTFHSFPKTAFGKMERPTNSSASDAPVVLNYSPTINVSGNADKKIKETFAAQLKAHSREIDTILAKRFRSARERA